MEECKVSKKRVRDEGSVMDFPESKLTRVDSNNSESSTLSCVDSDPESTELKRACEPTENSPESTQTQPESDESGSNSPKAKQIQEDLLEILDEPEAGSYRDQAIQGLDSVIKSFEEEIFNPAQLDPELGSLSGESNPHLGYLLEASDDELGLPPAVSSSTEEQKIDAVDFVAGSPETTDFGILGFEDEMPGYDSFGFGLGGGDPTTAVNSNHGGEYVALGGLFDYGDQSSEPDMLWRPESMPAV